MLSQNQRETVLSILNHERHAAICRLVSREDDEWIAAAEASLQKDATQATMHFQAANNLRLAREALAHEGAMSSGILSDSSPEVHNARSILAPLTYNRFRLRATVGVRLIQGYDDASTFARVITEIGCEKVAALGLVLNYHPLVSKEYQRLPHQRYIVQKIRCGDWIVVTHCNTERKKELLRQIGARLGVAVIVEHQ